MVTLKRDRTIDDGFLEMDLTDFFSLTEKKASSSSIGVSSATVPSDRSAGRGRQSASGALQAAARAQMRADARRCARALTCCQTVDGRAIRP